MKLNFREKGIPKWVKHRLGVLFLIFVGALVFFQIVLNKGEEEKKVTMADATQEIVTNGVLFCENPTERT